MSLELKQSLRMSQQLVMTPQLQQAIKLLQLSQLELQAEITKELEQNPLLEEPSATQDEVRSDDRAEQLSIDRIEAALAPPEAPADRVQEVRGEEQPNDIDWDAYLNNYQLTGPTTPSNKGNVATDDLPSLEATLTKKTSLFDHLVEQLRMLDLSRTESVIASHVLGNLDDAGYFRLEDVEGDPLLLVAQQVEEMLNEDRGEGAPFVHVPMETADRVLRKLQRLDPPGVCARDLQECLLIQARRLGVEGGLVGTIIRRHLKALESKNLPAIARDLKVTLEEVVAAARIISEMEPRPGRHFSDEEPQYITPDVYVHKVGEKYVVVVNDDGLSKLRISPRYREALKNGTAGANGTKDYIQERLRSAVWLIRSIHQRQRTIHKVTESIIKFQQDFLDKGIAHLKPLILKDVAEDIGMHESTVSRVTTNKYVHTPQGIFELKYFFNSGISKTGGDEVASEAVKNEIKNIVAAENPKTPYSDQKIVELLHDRGIEIARRTVAKYREVLGILPSSKRRSYY